MCVHCFSLRLTISTYLIYAHLLSPNVLSESMSSKVGLTHVIIPATNSQVVRCRTELHAGDGIIRRLWDLKILVCCWCCRRAQCGRASIEVRHCWENKVKLDEACRLRQCALGLVGQLTYLCKLLALALLAVALFLHLHRYYLSSSSFTHRKTGY